MPALPTYSLIEPHPSVPQNSPAIHTSRGGAGNVIDLKNTKTTNSRIAMGPPSRTRLDSHTPRTFKTGRGGAGNVHHSSERAIFSFDEELEHQLRHAAPVYHVGRGGAGNKIHSNSSSSKSSHSSTGGSEFGRRSSASSNASTTSTDSCISNADRALEKTTSAIQKGLGKLRE